MTTEIMTFNEFIADVADYELSKYMEHKYNDNEISLDEFHEYFTGNYQVHLEYLIETWKNSIDEDFVADLKIDYNRQGTFNELWDYTAEEAIPYFNDRWLDDIFERKILDTNVCLK